MSHVIRSSIKIEKSIYFSSLPFNCTSGFSNDEIEFRNNLREKNIHGAEQKMESSNFSG
jgi:hypothetical protein